MEMEIVNSIFIAIIEVISSAIPFKHTERRKEKQNQVFPSCPWTDECDKFLHFRKEALEKFKQTGLREDFINYKKSVVIMKRELRRIKQDKFRDFCEDLRKDRFILCLENSQKISIQIQSIGNS